MPPVLPQPPTVIEVYTPFFVGTLLNVFLYGVVFTQAYTYYRTSQNDKLHMKLLVIYLVVLETADTFLDIGLIFEPLLLKFGNQDVVVTSPWTLRLDGLTTALISTPVQIFMTWRIKVIMETYIPMLVIAILALSSLTGGVWLSISVFQNPQFAKFDNFPAPPILWLLSSAIADIAIACCLVYGLSKKRTGFAVLNNQIDRIIRVTIQTGSLTALTALLDVILSARFQHTTFNFSVDLMLSKMYTTTLLSSLNARSSSKLAEWNKVHEPNALFSNQSNGSSTNQQLTFNDPRTSRYVPNQVGQEEDSSSNELHSRTIDPTRSHRDRTRTNFNVVVAHSTVDQAGATVYPPIKPERVLVL